MVLLPEMRKVPFCCSSLASWLARNRRAWSSIAVRVLLTTVWSSMRPIRSVAAVAPASNTDGPVDSKPTPTGTLTVRVLPTPLPLGAMPSGMSASVACGVPVSSLRTVLTTGTVTVREIRPVRSSTPVWVRTSTPSTVATVPLLTGSTSGTVALLVLPAASVNSWPGTPIETGAVPVGVSVAV